MSIKNYLQQKKDPQGYAEMRMHELVLEMIMVIDRAKDEIKTQVSHVNEIKGTLTKVSEDTIRERETELTKTIERLSALLGEADEIKLQYEKAMQASMDGYEKTVADVVTKLEEKITSIKPIKGDKGDSVKGDKGEQGEKGVDGSSDTPEQIADKLNTTAEAVDMSVIKGLLKIIEDLKRAIRQKEKSGGGGGMGLWVHESFSVSSATTTITLSSNVAANSFAILAYYNGQFIVRGTHYTISGKVVTLLFTPDDSTKIDVTFVRT